MSLSLIQNFGENEFNELKQIYLQQEQNNDLTLIEQRRSKFHHFVLDADIDEGVNIRHDFIVDQLFLALEFSFQTSFSFDTSLALLEIINDEFEELLTAPPIPSPSASNFFLDLMSPAKAKALLQRFQDKVGKYGRKVDYEEWKTICDYLNKRLFQDLQSYYYFLHNAPRIVNRKIQVCIDTPLTNFPALSSTQTTQE